MYTQQEREEFGRIVKNPLEFLREELGEGGALCSSIFGYDDLENAPILVRVDGGMVEEIGYIHIEEEDEE